MNINFEGLIDIKIAIVLWIIGYAIKHSEFKPFKRLPNKLVPMILIVVGVGMSTIMIGDVTFESIIIGLVTALFAVGVHSSGKNIFDNLFNTSIDVDASNLNETLVDKIRNKNNVKAEEEREKKQGTEDDIIINGDDIIFDDEHSVG